ncbi:Uncharacterised protein [Mycobacteroides abscessus subsp. abscessus]|nr:Uncharacterised protein [Mycobacteroides abscessus subsp. abscessus]
MGVRHVPVCHCRDMHEAVLMHADIDKRAEGGHVRDDPFEHHADLQVRHLLDSGSERRGGECGPGVTARLLQLAENVCDGGYSEPVVGEVGRLE